MVYFCYLLIVFITFTIHFFSTWLLSKKEKKGTNSKIDTKLNCIIEHYDNGFDGERINQLNKWSHIVEAHDIMINTLGPAEKINDLIQRSIEFFKEYLGLNGGAVYYYNSKKTF